MIENTEELLGQIVPSGSVVGAMLTEKGDKGDKGDTGETGNDGFSPIITTSKQGKVTTLTIVDAEGTKTATINDGADGSGSGDMLKSTYDANENGIVDNAEKVNNHTVLSDVPANAVFTDTTYTAGTGIDITNGVISNTQTSAEWGNISGDITDQSDLQSALSDKADSSDLAVVATSGSYNDLSDKPTIMSGLTELSYGSSTWNDFITAYNNNQIVYCKASSGVDPSIGDQMRKAFMAYVRIENNEVTYVEFQYYRSIASHSSSQQGDQIIVYTLDKTNGWSFETREAASKVVAGNNMTSSYSSGVLTLNVSDNIAGDTLPIGSIVPYGSTTAPTNWLVCDGSAVSRTTYAELFAAIGTSFGSGDGSTTFNLPNLKGKVPVGYNSSDSDFDSIGETGGSKTHTQTTDEVGPHTHQLWIETEQSGDNYGLGQNAMYWAKAPNTWANGQFGVNRTNVNNPTPMNIMNPYQVVCYIIKAKQSAGVVANVSTTQTSSSTDTYSCNYVNDKVGVSLYDNSEGTLGNVTLSDSAANYLYLKILYINGDDYTGTIDVMYPNNATTSLTLNYYNTGTSKFMHWAGTIAISGTTITHANDYYYENNNGSVNAPQSINYIRIYKVIGYK